MVESALASAEHSLAARGLLRSTADGQLEVHPTLAAMLETCARPLASVLITLRTREQPEQRVALFLGSTSLVEQTFPADGVQVFRQREAEALESCLSAHLPLSDDAAPRSDEAALLSDNAALAARAVSFEHQPQLVEIMTLALEDPAAAARALEARGVATESAAELVETMRTARCNAAIVALRAGTEDAAGFALLAGDNGLWLLDSDPRPESDAVTATPAPAVAVRVRLAELARWLTRGR